MATGSADSKLFGERRQNYASSSDSDVEEHPSPTLLPPIPDGLPQTGPKGVLTDFYRHQHTEEQKRILAEKKRKELIQKHTATVQSHSEEQASKTCKDSAAMLNLARALEEGALSQDPFIQEFRAKRLEEMKQQAKLGAQRIIFGNLVEIRGDKYASIIDSTPPRVFVVIHIYDELLPSCQVMNRCLAKLAKVYPTVKFCRVQSYQIGVSDEFVKNGLPALLVYRGGEMKGNMLRVTDSLGEDFTTDDVEGFLQEKNCLPPESEKGDLLSPDANGRRILGLSSKGDSDSD